MDYNYMASVIEKITIERNKKVDTLILGEIQQIAIENGIETKIILNEKMVANALRKQIPTKVIRKGHTLFCPNCHECLDLPEILNFCYYCGQALDWHNEEGE